MNISQGKILRIGLASVIAYLIFKNLYNLLSKLVFWLSVELRLENEFLFVALNILMLVVSIIFLVLIYKSKIKGRVPTLKTIILLIGFSILIYATNVGLNYEYKDILIQVNLDNSRIYYLTNYGYTQILNEIFPLIVLIVFFIKIIRLNKA